MRLNEYQNLALATAAPLDDETRLVVGALGLAGEAGEYADRIKKHIAQGHPLDADGLLGELGDILWYIALAADSIGHDMETVAQHNIDKLKARYPEGFSTERSLHRE